MEQIPTEVIEKIAETFQLHKWMDNVMWNENQRQRTAAEYGYRLASPCALCEGKDEQLKESLLLYNNQTATIIKLEKECEGKEKEIAELKNNLINYRETVFNEWTEQETLKQRISELEAENEKLIMLTRKLLNK